MDVNFQWVQEVGGWGTLTVDSQHTFNFEDVVALFDETEEDLSGLAGHPEWVGNLKFTLERNEWSFFWGMNFIGSTDNTANFGFPTVTDAQGDQVNYDLKAESVTYHSFSVNRSWDNGVNLRLGIANAFDEIPPQITSRGTGNEVDTLGKVAFYSQYDWIARRYFVNFTMDFR